MATVTVNSPRQTVSWRKRRPTIAKDITEGCTVKNGNTKTATIIGVLLRHKRDASHAKQLQSIYVEANGRCTAGRGLDGRIAKEFL
jgi:hypothetical protein